VEFIIGNDKESLWKHSFEIGGQRLLDLFPYNDPILPDEVDQLNNFFDIQLAPLIEAIEHFKPVHFIGASGTFDTLTDMHYASSNSTKKLGQLNFVLPRAVFETMAHELIS